MDHKNYTTVDRIFELLDHLQQYILSYLSINEVVQSSVLSKRWNHVWTAIPILGFDTTLYGYREYKSKKNLDMQRKLQDFYILVEKPLGRHCKHWISIKEFTLTASINGNCFLLLIVGLTMWLRVMSKSCPLTLLQDIVLEDDKRIQKLVAGCPMIEEMRFLGCNGLKSIKFSALIKAKLIEVELNDDLERVDLGASNLYADSEIKYVDLLKEES
ncbi:F-box/LRR-repeat protein 25-like [Castanea sativa]|uniref:F-box/LRR-repeat protein 25-like n=1 Tax=Castanea sativa TaxID=21020 RepID=UPI003F64B53A